MFSRRIDRSIVAVLAVLWCLIGGRAMAAVLASEGTTTDDERAGGIQFGFGITDSENYKSDIRSFLSRGADQVEGAALWENLSVAYAGRIAGGLYIVPELILSFSFIETAIAGFESYPSLDSVMIVQFGGGLRQYLTRPGRLALYLQPSVRVIRGSGMDGFPVVADGLARELKGGLELQVAAWHAMRLGVEGGYAYIPVKPPIDPAYAEYYATPAGVLGGNYGGTKISVTISIWW